MWILSVMIHRIFHSSVSIVSNGQYTEIIPKMLLLFTQNEIFIRGMVYHVRRGDNGGVDLHNAVSCRWE